MVVNGHLILRESYNIPSIVEGLGDLHNVMQVDSGFELHNVVEVSFEVLMGADLRI